VRGGVPYICWTVDHKDRYFEPGMRNGQYIDIKAIYNLHTASFVIFAQIAHSRSVEHAKVETWYIRAQYTWNFMYAETWDWGGKREYAKARPVSRSGRSGLITLAVSWPIGPFCGRAWPCIDCTRPWIDWLWPCNDYSCPFVDYPCPCSGLT
jgi:hypothetical protein